MFFISFLYKFFYKFFVSFCRKRIFGIKMRKSGIRLVSIIPPRIDQFSSDHWSQTRTGRVSTYMGDRLGIPCVLSIFLTAVTLLQSNKTTWGTFHRLFGEKTGKKTPRYSGIRTTRAPFAKRQNDTLDFSEHPYVWDAKLNNLLIPFLSPISIV